MRTCERTAVWGALTRLGPANPVGRNHERDGRIVATADVKDRSGCRCGVHSEVRPFLPSTGDADVGTPAALREAARGPDTDFGGARFLLW